MKVLLVGEFSGVHLYLKDGLQELGHEVVLVSNGDGFKKIPGADITLKSERRGAAAVFLRWLNRYKTACSLKGKFDVTQFISNLYLRRNQKTWRDWFYRQFMEISPKNFCILGGEDCVYAGYWKDKQDSKVSKMINIGWKEDMPPNVFSDYVGTEEIRQQLRDFSSNFTGLIPLSAGYFKPYENMPNCRKPIPMPINVQKVTYEENRIQNGKLVVFHGINRRGTKGTILIEKAFEILQRRYPADLELHCKGRLPFDEYQNLLSRVNVVVDQTYSLGAGMNALISLAKGKVVLGGGNQDAADILGVGRTPVIDVIPSVDGIVRQIEKLLDCRSEFPKMGYEARQFVEKNHDCRLVAKRYLEEWSK